MNYNLSVCHKRSHFLLHSFHSFSLFCSFHISKNYKNRSVKQLKKQCQKLRKNGLHGPGSWAALWAMVGRPKNLETRGLQNPYHNSFADGPQMPFWGSGGQGPVLGAGAWAAVRWGQIRLLGCQKTKQKTARPNSIKTLPKTKKKRCQQLGEKHKVLKKHILIVLFPEVTPNKRRMCPG